MGGRAPRVSKGPAVSKPLSPRELEVVELIMEGHNNESVGYQLGISHETAKRHVGSILQKLRCSDRFELVVTIWKQKHAAEIARLHEHYAQIDFQSH